MGSRQGDVRNRVRELEADGYEVRPGGKHYKVYDGRVFVCQVPMSPSDSHWIDANRRDVARYERSRGMNQHQRVLTELGGQGALSGRRS
jgi:hypothetical protein